MGRVNPLRNTGRRSQNGGDCGSEVRAIRARLRSMADVRAARLAKSALRSPWQFYGVIPPRVRALAREVARRHRRDADLSGVLRIARSLWRSGRHEEMSLAIHLVATQERRLRDGDWAEFRGWIARARSADHCDLLALNLLGVLVCRDRSWCRVLHHWALSDNVWMRRAAVAAVVPRTHRMADVEAALAVCEQLMRDRAPEVQEAVAAALREASGRDPRLTGAFLERWEGKGRGAILEAARG